MNGNCRWPRIISSSPSFCSLGPLSSQPDHWQSLISLLSYASLASQTSPIRASATAWSRDLFLSTTPFKPSVFYIKHNTTPPSTGEWCTTSWMYHTLPTFRSPSAVPQGYFSDKVKAGNIFTLLSAQWKKSLKPEHSCCLALRVLTFSILAQVSLRSSLLPWGAAYCACQSHTPPLCPLFHLPWPRLPIRGLKVRHSAVR